MVHCLVRPTHAIPYDACSERALMHCFLTVLQSGPTFPQSLWHVPFLLIMLAFFLVSLIFSPAWMTSLALVLQSGQYLSRENNTHHNTPDFKHGNSIHCTLHSLNFKRPHYMTGHATKCYFDTWISSYNTHTTIGTHHSSSSGTCSSGGDRHQIWKAWSQSSHSI